MPELPEVETIKRVLSHNLMNQTVRSIDLYYQPLLENESYELRRLEQSQFVGFERRGKYLIFNFSNGLSWIVHLRMEGKFHLYDTYQPKSKHTHLILITEKTHVHYLDTRKFSRMAVVDDVDAYFEKRNLGLEPFDPKLNVAYLKRKLKNRTLAVKALLLDQTVITGIGNIYADEILYRTKLHPQSSVKRLKTEDLKHIILNTQAVLEKAIDEGGTTIRSYTSSLGVSGRFQVSLQAYGRFNQPCLRCGTFMEKVKVAQRTSVFCPTCQRVR